MAYTAAPNPYGVHGMSYGPPQSPAPVHIVLHPPPQAAPGAPANNTQRLMELRRAASDSSGMVAGPATQQGTRRYLPTLNSYYFT